MPSEATLDKIVSLAKRRGFAYQSAEIYGGINGIYDFGPLGAQLRQNIKNAWTHHIKNGELEVLFLDGSILGPEAVWKASGHVESFSDPLVDCLNCKKRYRADEINLNKACPSCGVKSWTDVRAFQMMFETNLGALESGASKAYLRPETAQAIFINFKNIYTSNRIKVPFGIAQIGKAFRNEITPKQFLFRMREFEQMELEFFCKQEEADHFFDLWVRRRKEFYDSIGLNPKKIRLRSHDKSELAHYAKGCTDVEYEFPFGWKELEGIANRGNFDLAQHSKFSGKELSVFDETTKQSYIPHVIECSVGVDRLFLTLLFDAYQEDEVDGEKRTVLKFHPKIAPVKAAVLPLSNKLLEQADKVYKKIKGLGYDIEFDSSGSIGKRYRRQDEIGTPVCFTYDFESEQDQMVTARDRDSLKQSRISIDQVENYLKDMLD